MWEKTEIAIPPLSFFHPRKEKDYQVSEPTIGLWAGQSPREEGSADCNAVRAERRTAKRVSICIPVLANVLITVHPATDLRRCSSDSLLASW